MGNAKLVVKQGHTHNVVQCWVQMHALEVKDGNVTYGCASSTL